MRPDVPVRLSDLLMMASACAMVVVFLAFTVLAGGDVKPQVDARVAVVKPEVVARRPAHPPLSDCTLFAEPSAYYYKDGYGYIIQNGRWINIGPQSPVAGVPTG